MKSLQLAKKLGIVALGALLFTSLVPAQLKAQEYTAQDAINITILARVFIEESIALPWTEVCDIVIKTTKDPRVKAAFEKARAAKNALLVFTYLKDIDMSQVLPLHLLPAEMQGRFNAKFANQSKARVVIILTPLINKAIKIKC